MKLFLAKILFVFCALPAFSDEVFSSYEDYESYVEQKIKNREFTNVVLRLGGADEFTPEQLRVIQNQLRDAVPYYLTDTAIMERVELSNGFSHEIRAFWNEKNSYFFYYALIHEREDGVLVLRFNMNTSSEELFKLY